MQALCSEVHKDNPPRRMVNAGLDWKRFDQIIAVLIKHGRLELWKQDARLNVVGGIAVKDPAADAAIAAAVVSSYNSRPLPPDMAFVGEIDLGGAALLRIHGVSVCTGGIYFCLWNKVCTVGLICRRSHWHSPTLSLKSGRQLVIMACKTWQFFGTVGLTYRSCTAVGELRVVTMLEKRVSDAVSLGFSKVVVPRGSLQGMAKKLNPHVIEIGSVRDLIQMLTK